MAYVGNTGSRSMIAVGLFFRDPDGRLVEAITYSSGDDARNA